MARTCVRPLAILAGMACFASAAIGESSAPPASLPANQYFMSLMAPSLSFPSYQLRLRTEFRRLDADGNGEFDAADVELHVAVAMASLRSTMITNIMRHDLNGDGAVTEDEARQLLSFRTRNSQNQQQQKRVETMIRNLMAADADKDGRVTFEEALEAAKTQSSTRSRRAIEQRMLQTILELAGAGGKVTPVRFEAAGEAIFRAVDTDKDDSVSRDELEAYRRQLAGQPPRTQGRVLPERVEAGRDGCSMPQASGNAKVVLLSAYEADAVSTATIGSQDVAIRTGSIEIEPGDEPLYVVVASSRAIIWRFTGAVERVERLVLTSASTGPGEARSNSTPLVGATGIASDRITFLPRPICLRSFTDPRSGEAARAANYVGRETGKDIAVTAANYQVSGFSVPSGKVRAHNRSEQPLVVITGPNSTVDIKAGPGVIVQVGPGDLAREVARFYPGGVVEIDPASVVASRPVERYVVLPNQPGLLQLVQSGALERNNRGDFLIKRQIRFPAELHGAHSARFRLLRGVPMPEGSPGHSCVIIEETGYPWDQGRTTC